MSLRKYSGALHGVFATALSNCERSQEDTEGAVGVGFEMSLTFNCLDRNGKPFQIACSPRAAMADLKTNPTVTVVPCEEAAG